MNYVHINNGNSTDEITYHTYNNFVNNCTGWNNTTGWTFISTKKENTRMLYEIFVVDPETEEVMGPYYAVAKDGSTAQLKAFSEIRGDLTKPVEDYDFIINGIGKVREKKEVQEVKIVEK